MAGTTYTVTIIENNESNVTLKLGFGTPAQNDEIVRDAVAAVKELSLEGGKVVRLNGPASLPVAIAIAHEVGHKFGAVAAFDPKLGKYVVAISHDPSLTVGDLID
ncbi:MAG: CRISPR-associated protein Csx3 [bacterium]